MSNKRTFSYNQQVDDVTMLLYRLGTVCLEHMEQEMLGIEHKHGYLQNPHLNPEMTKDYRSYLSETAMDLFQELGMSKEEVLTSWDNATKSRDERNQYIEDAKKKGYIKSPDPMT